jgi:omega-6 fatty acid desaturase (delta-12 desaturase)
MKSYDYSAAGASKSENPPCIKDIAAHCRTYQGANTARSIIQLFTTLALFAVTLTLMFFSIKISYLITLAIAIPASGLLVRIFIFQHDCGHASFFNSKKANDWVGRSLSLLTFTPYDFWRRAHNKHHATSGDLGHRSIGGIDTITVKEYQDLSKLQQFAYRIYRNPIILLMLGTPFYVLIAQRTPLTQKTNFFEDYHSLPARTVWKSVMLTNAALIIFFGCVSLAIGLKLLIALYLPVLMGAAWIGGWLFYVQHQFEETYWEESENWSRQEAALMGSSYYELPKVIQWFVGNIGLHHIHHLCSKIPNYKLKDCMDTKPVLKSINRLTFTESLKCIHLKLWDEQQKKLVPIPATD